MYSLSPLVVGAAGSPSFTTNSLGANDPQVGDTRVYGNENYVFCYNNGNSQILPGDGVILSAVSGYSVTLSSTTSVDLLVGVVKHATIATGYYGYVCTRGFVNVNMGTNLSAAAGSLLILAADGKFTSKTIATGFVGDGTVKLMSAAASGASATAYVSVY